MGSSGGDFVIEKEGRRRPPALRSGSKDQSDAGCVRRGGAARIGNGEDEGIGSQAARRKGYGGVHGIRTRDGSGRAPRPECPLIGKRSSVVAGGTGGVERHRQRGGNGILWIGHRFGDSRRSAAA